MTRRRRLLVAAPFAPRTDARHGGSKAIAELLTGLASDHDIALAYLRGEDELGVDVSVQRACDVWEVRRPWRATGGRASRALRLGAGVVGGTPMWVRRWHVPAFSDQLRNLVQTWHPDIVQFEFHLMAQYAGAIRPAAVPLVLVQHEPGSSIARERCHYSGWLNRPIVLADYYAWRRYERRMLAGFDRVVTFTDRDGEAARTANAAVRTTTIPLGITIPPAPLSAGDGASILFIGSFVHAPNEDAAIRLATRILPLVRRRIPDATVTIVGSEPPPRVAALADASVRVHGSVDDVTPYLDRAAVFAAPLRFGGGMRVKILEALAAGKAVVCSPQAAEGLSVRHGVELKLAATDEEFADTIVELFDCPARRLALAGAARQWAEANAASRMCADAFRSLYDTLLAAPVAPPEPVSGTTVPIA